MNLSPGLHVRAIVCVAALFILLTGCATANKDAQAAELRLRIGTSYLAQGNYPAALTELLMAEKLDPKSPMIQNNLGLAYFFRERYDLSAQHLKRATELQPTFSEARNNYARVLVELGRTDQAITELNRVLGDLTYGEPEKAWLNLGLAYFRRKDFAQANEKFAQAIRINREYCLGQTFYGRSFLEMGQFQNAARVLDNAVIICGPIKYDEPHYYSGIAYYKMGKTSFAASRMEEVIKLYPEGTFAKRAESLLKSLK